MTASAPGALVVNPCRSLCSWRSSRAAKQLFVCAGCGSHWEPGQAWTPIDADGRVPDGVFAARAAETAQRPDG